MDESMEKRILLSFALSLAVLMAFSWLFAPPPPVPEVVPETGEQVTFEIEPPAAGREIVPPQPAPTQNPNGQTERSIEETAFRAVDSEVLAEELQAERIEQIIIDTERFEVRISNEGGRLENVQLKDYAGAEGDDSLELIGQEAGESVGWPLAIATGDSAIDEAIEAALFVADQIVACLRLLS